jgi:excisionase family DNA binding protein
MTDTKQSLMLTVEAVADRMNVSERTVFRWIKTDRLKAFRTGRILRVSEMDLHDFINGRSRI